MTGICGIIAEYNPMHNGHIHHIKEARKLGARRVVAVISGNFVQRGEPAVLDKFARTRIALESGIDAVFELPTIYCAATSQIFARAAVKILGDSGIIDSFCFGCETGNLGDLLPIVNILSNEPPEFRASLRKHLDSGLSFAQSRSAALGEINSEYSKIIRKPNNILAVEYLIAQQNLAPHLNPIAIPRKLLEHHSLEFMENFATSSGIRASIDNDITKLAQFMSPPGFAALLEAKQKVGINRLDNFSHILHHIFATKPKNDIAKIAEITEGMENRLIAKAARHFLISDIINAAATKRYPRTAISRGVLHILLGITKAEMARFASPEYIRVLGFRRESADLIGELSRKSALPIVTNLKNSHKLPAGATKILAREIYFSNLYQLGLRSANFPQKSEFPAPIIV